MLCRTPANGLKAQDRMQSEALQGRGQETAHAVRVHARQWATNSPCSQDAYTTEAKKKAVHAGRRARLVNGLRAQLQLREGQALALAAERGRVLHDDVAGAVQARVHRQRLGVVRHLRMRPTLPSSKKTLKCTINCTRHARRTHKTRMQELLQCYSFLPLHSPHLLCL